MACCQPLYERDTQIDCLVKIVANRSREIDKYRKVLHLSTLLHVRYKLIDEHCCIFYNKRKTTLDALKEKELRLHFRRSACIYLLLVQTKS